MNRIFTLVLVFLSTVFFGFSQSKNDRKAFLLLGNVIGKDSGSFQIIYSPVRYIRTYNSFNPLMIVDTAIIKKGRFYFEGFLSAPTRVIITEGNRLKAGSHSNITSFFMDPGVSQITLKMDDFNHPEVTGSITQEESSELVKSESDIHKILRPLDSLYLEVGSSYFKNKDPLLVPQINYLYDQNEILVSQIKAVRIGFIRSHPRSFISETLLNEDSSLIDDLSLDSLKSFYNGLDTLIQNQACGQKIKKEIEKKEISDIGKSAPDFNTEDFNNQPLRLSSFQGKNEVLLYFWGSRNPLSRKSFPLLKEIYQKYHAMGLEVICISTEFKKEEWVNAVKQDNLELFHNVIISSQYVHFNPLPVNIMEDYSVTGIPYDSKKLPVEILIDKSGKIIGRWKENFQGLNAKLVEVYQENKN